MKQFSCPQRLLPLALLGALLFLQGCTYYTLKQDPVIDTARFATDPPASLAVMPVRNRTEKKSLDDIVRRGLYSSLSVLHYRDTELPQVDEMVASRSLTLRLPAIELPPEAFEPGQPADALLYAEVERASKVWLFLYSHIRLKVDLRLVDSRNQSVIYSNETTLHKRRIALPTSIGGLIQTFLLSLWQMRDDEMEVAMEEYGKEILEDFPDPGGNIVGEMTIERVLATTQHEVLRAGDKLRVELIGTPGQVASFDIGQMAANIPMREESPGSYVGEYVCRPGDLSDTGVVRGRLIATDGQVVTKLNVEGDFRINAQPPPRPRIQRVRFVSAGVQLDIGLPREEPGLQFEIYRADHPDREFVSRDTVGVGSWVDRQVEPGKQYRYLVRVRNEEGAISQESQPRTVSVPMRGPTRLPTELTGNRILHPYSSPYILSGPTRLSTGSILQVQAGTELQIPRGAALVIAGPARFEGTERNPIVISGGGQGMLLAFQPPSTSTLLAMRYTTFREAEVGLAAQKGQLDLEKVRFEECAHGLALDRLENLRLSRSAFVACREGVTGSVGSALIEFCEFRDNPRAMTLYCPSLRVLKNDFLGKGVALEQLAPVQSDVDYNFLDETDPFELLRRVQGPLNFRTLYQTPSRNQVLFSPFADTRDVTLERADRYYQGRNYRLALRDYLSAWHMYKDRRVGERLLEILDGPPSIRELLAQDKQIGEFFTGNRNVESALLVARTLARMEPGDRELQERYADLLERLGYEVQARAVRQRAGYESRLLELPDFRRSFENLREEFRDFLLP